MTMTARYAGKCSKCGGRVLPGQQIDWNKGTHATQHIACPAQSVKARAVNAQPSGCTHSRPHAASGAAKHCWECGCAYHGRTCPRCGEEEY